jgi:hypothetical protein
MTLMAGQTHVRKAFFVLAVVAIWTACLTAQASAQPSAASATKRYGQTAVTRAFRAAGIGLYNTGYGAVQPVTTLASTKAHQGWNLAIYIYLTPAAASASYRGSIKTWQGAGMAAALKKNVVVAVVPKDRISTAKKAKPWPLPELVAKTLASLPS